MIFEDSDRIVFAGDSVTDADSAQPVGESMHEQLGHGYVRVIDTMIATWYPELKIRINNAGVGGNTSRDLLARFDRDVIALNPNWVSICIGINDVWRQFDAPAITDMQVQVDEYEKNMIKMIEKTKVLNNLKGIFIISPYYIEQNRDDLMRKRIDEYIAVCKKLAKKYDCTFVDIQNLYERYLEFRHSSFISWDRVHTNQIGAALVAKEFLSICGFDYDHKSI